VLRQKLRKAKSYDEWKEAALTMDDYLGFNDWKKEEEDPYHDYLLVKKVRELHFFAEVYSSPDLGPPFFTKSASEKRCPRSSGSVRSMP